MITLNNNVIYTNSNCSSVTSKKNSPRRNVYSIGSHKLNRNKENRIVSLKPRKIYPLPLPKSVPHLSINFFTDHLFTNCIFRDGTGLLDDKCEGYLEKSEDITVNQRVKYSQSRKLEAVTSSTDNIYSKPKTVAPDFKLREKRQLLKNYNFESDFQKIKPTRRLECINTLIGTINSKEKFTKTQNKINTDTDIPQKNNSNFRNLLKEIKLKDTLQNNKSNTDKSDNINNNKTKFFNDKKLSLESTHPTIRPIDNLTDIKGNTRNTEKISIYKENYLKNLASKNPRINKKNNILLQDNGETFNFLKSINVLHLTKYLQNICTRTAKEGDKLPQCELYRYNKLNDINKRKREPEDLSKSIICFNNSSLHCTAKSEFNSFHNLINTISKTLLYDKILYVYTRIINKIEACVTDSQSQNLIAEVPNKSYKMVYPLKNQNITVGFSEESVDDYYDGSKSKEAEVSGNANDKTEAQGLISKLRAVFSTNISESLCLGPSLDEVLLGVLNCLRYIAERVGIMKPTCNDICRCTMASIEEQTRELHKNNLDVVKWLHDEYINLATDVAEANEALEHKCLCTKDNCPVVLQSRRFVLDRLAELLEKKQELENAYRRKMKKCCQPDEK